jgi:hypothetical protein
MNAIIDLITYHMGVYNYMNSKQIFYLIYLKNLQTKYIFFIGGMLICTDLSDRSFAGIVGSNPTVVLDAYLLYALRFVK